MLYWLEIMAVQHVSTQWSPLSSSFTLSLQSQHLPFQQILPTLTLLLPLDLSCFSVSFQFVFNFSVRHVLDTHPAFYCTLNTHYRIIHSVSQCWRLPQHVSVWHDLDTSRPATLALSLYTVGQKNCTRLLLGGLVSGVKSGVLCRSSSVLLHTRGALESESHQQLDRCLAAAVWAARHQSNMQHSLLTLAAWKPHQCTSAWRHQLKPTRRNTFIRNQWGTSISWSSMWLKRGQQPAELHGSSNRSVARLF